MATKKRPPPQHDELPTNGTMMGTEILPAYELRGILYVPHYHLRAYVRPGYGKHNTDTYAGIELKAMGAKQVEESLWSRAEF